jgi:hypothetical protein
MWPRGNHDYVIDDNLVEHDVRGILSFSTALDLSSLTPLSTNTWTREAHGFLISRATWQKTQERVICSGLVVWAVSL